MLRGLLTILVLSLTTGCWSRDGLFERSSVVVREDMDRGAQRALPIPTSTEVLLVNGKPLSISGYLLLREQFPKLPRDQVLWIAQSALALQDEARELGRELTLSQAVDLARYSIELISVSEAESALKTFQGSSDTPLEPKAFRQNLERILSQSVVQRNPQVLAELH